jgi:hypothetical protein
VFIHGLQGHPKGTWLHKPPSREGRPKGLRRFFRKRGDDNDQDSNSTTSKPCYWPDDLLALDFPTARIATYGYDSKVSNFFKGAANQSNIVGHGTSLLNDLEAFRRSKPRRPMIFVVHSLGGLVLKEALRQSWQAQPYEKDLREVYDATRLIIFMGTPHRGSNYASWGVLARNVAVAVGFDANDRVLRDLEIDSAILEVLRRDFAKMLREDSFDVWTFIEGKGLKGVRGLTGKVCPFPTNFLALCRLIARLRFASGSPRQLNNFTRLSMKCPLDWTMRENVPISSVQITCICAASQAPRMLDI